MSRGKVFKCTVKDARKFTVKVFEAFELYQKELKCPCILIRAKSLTSGKQTYFQDKHHKKKIATALNKNLFKHFLICKKSDKSTL